MDKFVKIKGKMGFFEEPQDIILNVNQIAYADENIDCFCYCFMTLDKSNRIYTDFQNANIIFRAMGVSL